MTDTPLPRRVPGFDVDDRPATRVAKPDHRTLINNHDFLADCARYLEGLYSRSQVKKRWRNIDDATWDLLGADNELVDAIELERTRRIRDGSAKREKAQQLVVKGPAVLDGIMSDTKASPKHRIDAAKALDQFAGGNNPDAVEQNIISIRIDMGSDVRARGGTPSPNDVLIFEATPNPNNTIDSTAQELPPPHRGPGRPPITDGSDE